MPVKTPEETAQLAVGGTTVRWTAGRIEAALKGAEAYADKKTNEFGVTDRAGGIMRQLVSIVDELVRSGAQRTPAGNRYEAARKALSEYNAVTTEDTWGSVPGQMAAALRSFIEPPATAETPERIAGRVADDWMAKGKASDRAYNNGDIYEVALAGVQAGRESSATTEAHISHAEAQELHGIIGGYLHAFKAQHGADEDVVADFTRALEISAVIVSDTDPDRKQ